MPGLQQQLNEALAGRYRVERELGAGGMARVFLAEDLRHGRRVAVKVMRPELAHATSTERFQREVETAAKLSHPRILPLIDSGAAGDLRYFVMPYVTGGSLRDRLAREGPLPIADAVAIARAVADGLEHAHAAGVVHRDVKPENVLLLDGEPVLADFGLARPADDRATDPLTATGVTVGTPGYMSPEQLAGAEIGARSDVFNLGLLLYEMLAGQSPFTAPSREMLVHQVLNAPAPDVRHIRPQVPPGISDAITRALAKLPADRFKSAREFGLAITAAGGTAAAQAAELESARTLEAVPAVSRKGGLALRSLALVTIAVLVAGAAIFILLRGRWPGSRSAGTADAVAIFPFGVQGDPSLEYLGEGLVTLMSGTLGDGGGLRAVDPRRVLGAARKTHEGPLDPETAARAARDLGASYFVLGDVVKVGQEIRLQTSLYAAHDWQHAQAVASVQGAPDSIADLIDRTAATLLASRERFSLGHLTGVASRTTRSLPALKAFLEGKRLYVANDARGAAIAFRTATELDSTFALAWFWFSDFAGAGASDPRVALRRQLEAVRTGLRWSARLPEREREALLAREALFLGDADRSERICKELLEKDPDDVAAWHGLFLVYANYNPLRGRNVSERVRAARRILQLQPDALAMLAQVIRQEAKEGRLAEADSLSRYLLHERPRDGARSYVLAIRAIRLGDGASEDSLRATWTDGRGPMADVLAFATASTLKTLESAYRFLLRNPVPSGASTLGPMGPSYTLALFEAARGRARDACRALDTTAAASPADAPPMFWLLTAMDLPMPREKMSKARDRLVAWKPDPAAAWGDSWEDPRLLPSVRCYLLGLLEIRLGRPEAAKSWALELARQRRDPEVEGTWKNMLAGLNAELALEAHDEARALRLLEAAPEAGPRFVDSPYSDHAHERYLRARLLQRAHRGQEARRWYDTLGDASMEELVLMAPSFDHLGEICEEAGDVDGAISYYRRFLELWKDCDPELRPRIDEARRRMELLQSRRS